MKANPIDIVKQISTKEFKKNYLIPQKPLIIKGLAEETPAGKKWTIEYIKEVCGDVMVDVFDNSNPNNASAFTTPDLKMRFEEYVTSIIKDEPSTLRMFLFNMFKARPALRKEFPCPKI